MSTHLINRKFMPQIDEKDLVPLLSYLATIGVNCSFQTKSAGFLKRHQEVDMEKVKGIMGNPEALKKPLLVAQRGCMLDGNHRGAAHTELKTEKVCMIIVPLPYEEALLVLAEAPESYSYGDGNFHPISA